MAVEKKWILRNSGNTVSLTPVPGAHVQRKWTNSRLKHKLENYTIETQMAMLGIINHQLAKALPSTGI